MTLPSARRPENQLQADSAATSGRWRDPPLPRAGDWKSALALVSQLAIAVAAIGLVAGPFGRWSYICDLASHFRFQYVLVLMVSGVTLAWTRTKRGLLATAAGVAILAWLIPYMPRHPASSDIGSLRVVSMNILFTNQKHQQVTRFLQRQQADIVVLIELTSAWLEALEPSMKDYPFRSYDSQHRPFGIAIYSRFPINSKRTLSASEAYVCEIRVADAVPLRLIATHTPAPMTRRQWHRRNALFRMLAAEVASGAEQPRTLLIGDLNCTPWSPWFQWLMRESGLRDSAVGHGLWPTWYALPTWLAGIPIDHALVGGQIEVLRREVGPPLGSDHRPLTVDVRVREPEAADAG